MSEAEIDHRKIIGWHCHVYFEPEQRDVAARLNEGIQDNFKIWDYRWLDETNRLHPLPMFRFQFTREDLARYIEWITLNREGLSVLVHAITGDNVFDHTYNTMWLGKPLFLDIDALKELQAKAESGELPASMIPKTQVGKKDAEAGRVRFKPGDDQHAG